MAQQHLVPRSRTARPAAGWAHSDRQWLLVAAVVVLALNAATLVWQSIRPAGVPVAEGSRADTSFGWMTVPDVEVLDGLSNADVGGMSHGVAGFVDATKAQVLVGLVLANTTDHAVAVDPSAFSLRLASGAIVQPAGGTLAESTIPAGSRLEARLAFVIPRQPTTVVLELADPDGRLRAVDAGAVQPGVAPAPEEGGHHQ